jgi:hypothetical protein
MLSEYPKAHMTRVMGLDALIFIVGLATLVSPLLMGDYPADIDTTAHVALGALIAVLAVFRVLIAYGAVWIEVCLFFLGLIVLRMPAMTHMQWDPKYNTGHLVAGGAVMVLSVISAALTVPVLKQGK